MTATGGDNTLDAVYDADGHPDAVTLAGLSAGAFDGATAQRLHAHVRDCGQCRADITALQGVPAQLSALPAPRMPDAVADRLSAAIRAAADERAQARGTGGAPQAPTGVHNLDTARERRSRRTRRMGLAAAGVAVLAAGGIAIGVTRGGNDTSGHPNAAGNPTVSRSAGGEVSPDNRQGHGTGPNLRLPVYTAQTLRGKIPSIVAGSGIGLNAPGGSAAGLAGRMGVTATRTACAAAIGTTGRLLAVQHARFGRQEAYVFVFRTDVARQVDVAVVSPECGSGGAHQLYRTTAAY